MRERLFTKQLEKTQGSAAHFHSVAVATQLVHRLQIRPGVHN